MLIMKYANKGFTLIELLVVIAIIGVLAAVIVPNLNSARTKGNDAAVMSNINGTRAQAALYYDDNNASYAGLCDTTPLPTGTKTINEALYAAQVAWGTTTQALNISLSTAGDGVTFTCHENGSAYAIEGPLKASTTDTPVMWCLDSVGSPGQKSTTLGTNDVTCD